MTAPEGARGRGTSSSAPPHWRRMWGNVVFRTIVYYALLVGVAALTWEYLPPTDVGAAGGDGNPLTGGDVIGRIASNSLSMLVLLAMITAVLASIPVAWIYTLTRQKRGFQQSVVQMLVLLPPVVAGIVMLVKHSLALAFSLAGAAAAVRFRNTLDDSKDAAYAFLAIGIGIAAAVELPVALVLSIVFNVVILGLWYTDFGRVPAALEGKEAQRKLERALAAASRTGTFVARLDKELFEHMSPEQLEAAADKAQRRRRRNAPDFMDADVEAERDNLLLRVGTFDAAAARKVIEPVLEERVKRWRYGGLVREQSGTTVIEYTVDLKRREPAASVLDALRDLGGHVVRAELK
ncbi:MAG TPA: DUF4956 domain-containing protein [Gemmatimonadaceae bacterium]|nr:DUF4956 domain-containing protein [Gemmatimonadaceae bacterium]